MQACIHTKEVTLLGNLLGNTVMILICGWLVFEIFTKMKIEKCKNVIKKFKQINL